MARFTLTKVDTTKWKTNVIEFLLPVGLLYISTVIGAITANNGAVTPEMFIPSQIALGGMVLYVLNGLYDIGRKWTAK